MKMIVSGLTALMLVSGAQAATIVMNGDFEVVDGRRGVTTGGSDGQRLDSLAGASGNASWDVFSSLPGGWTSTVGGGIEVQTQNTLGSVNAHSGLHYIELDSESEGRIGSNSDMVQNLGALDAGRYALSFWYRPRTGQGATDGVLAELLGGASFSQGVVGTNTTEWVNFIFDFTALGGADVKLRFAATGAADRLGGFIDTVSVAAIPLPAPALLLIGGLGALGLLRARRGAAITA